MDVFSNSLLKFGQTDVFKFKFLEKLVFIELYSVALFYVIFILFPSGDLNSAFVFCIAFIGTRSQNAY